MNLIDTHTHLYLEQFDEDRDEVVQRAISHGVGKMFLPNIDKDSISDLLNLQKAYPDNFYIMAGLHPTSVKADYKDQLQRVSQELEKGNYIAVGEIGIDLYWDTTFAQEQREALLYQFELSILHNLPVVIHSRDSFQEIISTIEEFNNPKLRGVFHCFTGTKEEAEIITRKGFYLGIGGVVTFKNSGLDKHLQDIPLEHLVLETDAPYLTPAPFRGKRNESSYVFHVADKLSQVYGKSVEEIAEITTANANKLFNIK